MSGLFRKIGKVFRKVVKVVKRIALPVLAVGAAVLTGGAALGLGLPTLGSAASAVGLGSLTPVLTAAGQGALFGGATSLISGKNPLKGITRGFITGGVLGGFSQAVGGLPGATGAPKTAMGTGGATSAASTASDIVVNRGAMDIGFAQPAAAAAAPAAQASSSLVQAGGRAAGGLIDAAGNVVNKTGGFLGSMFRDNPVVAGQMLAVLGEGLMASQAAKAERKQNERNYSGLGGLMTEDDVVEQEGLPNAGEYYNSVIRGGQKYAYNPSRGRISVAG